MGIFDVGPFELIVIFVVALLVFGPNRLPEFMGQVGRWVRTIRRLSDEVTRDFVREMNLDDARSTSYTYQPPVPPPPPYVPPVSEPVAPSGTAGSVSENAEPPADAPSAPTTDGVTAPSGATADEATAPSGATADEATAPSGATADEATVLENSAPPADAPAQPSYGAHLGDDEPVGAIPFSPVNRPDSGTEAVPPAHANGASQPAGPVAELPPTRSTP